MFKKLAARIIPLLAILLLMTGCFNSKTESGDVGKGVTLQRTSDGLKVIAEDDFVAGEYILNKSVLSDNINAGDNKFSIVSKNEKGECVVSIAALKGEIVKGQEIFTIKNCALETTVEESNVIKSDELEKEMKKATKAGATRKVVRTDGVNMLLGDFNNDYTVNVMDFIVFAENYGGDIKCDIAPADKGTGDWEGIFSIKKSDGVVNLLDFVIFAANYGTTVPPQIIITGLDTVEAGKAITLTANTSVIWSSLDSSVATVSPTTGTTTTVTGVKAGTVSIKAVNGTKSVIYTVDVTGIEAKPTAIVVTGDELVYEGKTLILTSAVKYSDGTTKSELVAWTSSDATVASCQASGITTTVTGIKAGSTVIKAEKEVNGVKVSIEKTITVKAAQETGITIYVQKPTAWTNIYIWYDSDLSTPLVWDTTVLASAPGVMDEYRTGWFKKNLPASTKATFLFNNGTWASKMDTTGVTTVVKTTDFTVTSSVWIKNDGTQYSEDPEGPQKPTLSIDSLGGFFNPSKTVNVTVASETAILSKKYTLNGVEKELTGNTITFGNDLADGEKVTLSVSATNAQGITTVGPYTFTKGESKMEKVAFVTPTRLGAQYTTGYTTFTLWSPDSTNVTVTVDGVTYTMDKVADFNGYTGVYGCTISGNLENMEYQLKVNGKNVRDPYGKMVKYDPALADGQGTSYVENTATCTANTGSSVNIVMNMDKTKILWSARPELKEREDSIIYEISIRDFTISGNSGVTATKKGKYLGMVETGTTNGSAKTGIDHLKELGVTHVQIMPFYDFATKKNGKTGEIYNWGYDPVNYNVPEERFSQTPADYEARIKEVKTMVDEYHKNGIRVVMDVVYNHTFWDEMFKDITSKYYIYLNGKMANASGCGNGVDTSNAMVSRFIRDSLEYWAEEYNLDGFRFDLMAIYKVDAVNGWGKYLNEKYPDRNILMYGEPWTGMWHDDTAGRAWAASRPLMSEGHVGTFNGGFRESIKGGNDDATTAFMFNWTGTVKGGTDMQQVMDGLKGGVMNAESSSQQGASRGAWWMYEYKSANDPEQSVNYISAHDNYALWDKVNATVGGYSQSDKIAINNFGTAILMTAQGMPFLHSGDEFLRTKHIGSFSAEAHNSYMWGTEMNQIDWSLKTTNAKVFDYFKSVIKLRKEHPGFRMNTLAEVNSNVSPSNSNGVITNYIKAGSNGDSWNEIKVIYNPNSSSITTDASGWTKVFDSNGFTTGTDGTCNGRSITVFKK